MLFRPPAALASAPAFALALALLAGAAPNLAPSLAHAQIPTPVPSRIAPAQPPADAVISGVEVTAPRTIERSRYGVLTQEISMSVRVPYNDLDMQSPAGVAALDKRVSDAADYACKQLGRMYPDGTPEEYYCAKAAVRDAQPQVILARGPG